MKVDLKGHGVEQFETERLIGRRLMPTHLNFLSELHQDDDVMKIHGGKRSVGITERFVQSNAAHWRRFQFGLWIISRTDEPDVPIGRAGLRWDRVFDDSQACDISCILAKEFWNHGIATETVKVSIAIGLKLGLPLVAGSEARHGAARRVMEKSGLVYWSDYSRNQRTLSKYQWPVEASSPAIVEGMDAHDTTSSLF